MNLITGLSTKEAENRHIQFGPNEIVSSRLESGLSDLKTILLDPLGLMLLSLGGLYAFLGDKTDAIVLFLAYIPVTAVNVILHFRARKALQALRSTLQLTANVLRDNEPKEIPIRNIVRGDVLIFDE